MGQTGFVSGSPNASIDVIGIIEISGTVVEIRGTSALINNPIYIEKYNSAGNLNTQHKVFFFGNGETTYEVIDSYLQQGSITVPVTCNGKRRFLVPAYGRWSDSCYISSFLLPGTINCYSEVKNNIPLYDDSNGNNVPVIVGAVDDCEETTILASDQFEGENGSRVWDGREGLGTEIVDTSQKYSGESSVKILLEEKYSYPPYDGYEYSGYVYFNIPPLIYEDYFSPPVYGNFFSELHFMIESLDQVYELSLSGTEEVV
jgi:hypothetical protein